MLRRNFTITSPVRCSAVAVATALAAADGLVVAAVAPRSRPSAIEPANAVPSATTSIANLTRINPPNVQPREQIPRARPGRTHTQCRPLGVLP